MHFTLEYIRKYETLHLGGATSPIIKQLLLKNNNNYNLHELSSLYSPDVTLTQYKHTPYTQITQLSGYCQHLVETHNNI